MTKRIAQQRQCRKCPWKVTSDPRQIPGGYCERKHANLASTIATGTAEEQLTRDHLRVMACHESAPGQDRVCVGWLHQQLTTGNNLALRLRVIRGHVNGDYVLDGVQHATLADTLPPEVNHG
jgi:hypothetical protein